ncbi:DUF1589 domain-containing protein [Rhodopirellula baltica]
MEQSEACSQHNTSSKQPNLRPITIARYNLAYVVPPARPIPQSSSRRPCSTWRPNPCFGTKRGVLATQPFIETSKPPANHQRQVQPGLRRSTRLTKLAIVIPVGHVPHGIPTDALEHSEA